jgi:nicotinate-nucleotide adenylyltransferase
MRVGYFGGSFDPPHRGHLRVALAAAKRFELERVLLAPTGSQPFKPDGLHAAYADRLEMVRRLVEREAGIEASEIDEPMQDGSHNYTVNALRRLRNDVGVEDEILSIVGIDAFLDIRMWREPEKLFELAEWVVVSRPGFDLSRMDEIGLVPSELRRVRVLDRVSEDVSATELRRMLHDGEDVGELVPSRVVEYIRARGLYR